MEPSDQTLSISDAQKLGSHSLANPNAAIILLIHRDYPRPGLAMTDVTHILTGIEQGDSKDQ
jgi:hypothetical protein